MCCNCNCDCNCRSISSTNHKQLTCDHWLRVSTAWCRDISWRLFVGHPGLALWPFCKLCTFLMVEVRFPSWDREAFLNFAQVGFLLKRIKSGAFVQNYISLFNLVGISLVIWRLQRQSNTLDYEHQKCFEDFLFDGFHTFMKSII